MVVSVIFLIVSAVIILLVSRGSSEGETLGNVSTIEELRRRQVQGLREHAIKRKFEENVEIKTDRDKKHNMEETMMRAGLDNWRYGEYVLVKFSLTLLGVIISWLFARNIVITGGVGFVMYLLPGQIIQAIANKRTQAMEADIGTFIQLTVERYKVHGDFQRAIKQSAPDFKGHEPLYTEIRKTILDFNVGVPTAKAVESMSKRTGNKFIHQLANYYDIASTIGTEASRNDIIGQAWLNFNDDYKMRKQHEQEIDGPKKDAYIIVVALPILMLYQARVDDNYINFFMNTTLGQVGLAIILVVTILSIIFINKKIGAPLD